MANEPGEGGRKPDSVRALAAASRLSLSQMAQAKKAGVDCKDLEALKAFRGTVNTRSDERTSPSTPSEKGAKMTVEEIEEELSFRGLSPNEARVLKIQLEGLKAAAALRQQRNELMSRAEIDDRDSRIMHALQGMFRRMESEIPALCYGLGTLGEMKDVVKAKIREAQAMYADESSEFWKSYPEG